MSNYKSILDEMENYGSVTPSSAKQPNWMIEIPKFTSSSVEGFTKFAYLYDHRFAITRGIESAVSHTIKPDGGVEAHDLKIVLPSSSLDARINWHFSENNEIPKITIARLVTSNKKPQMAEEYIFTTCFVSGILTRGDIMCIAFRYAAYTRNSHEFKTNGQKGGTHQGHHDLITAKSSGK